MSGHIEGAFMNNTLLYTMPTFCMFNRFSKLAYFDWLSSFEITYFIAKGTHFLTTFAVETRFAKGKTYF